MSVEFNASRSLKFDNIASCNDLVRKTIVGFGYVPSFSGLTHVVTKVKYQASPPKYFGWRIYYSSSNLYYQHSFSTSNGNWLGGQGFPNGEVFHFALSYDGSSVANDPVFYKNGVVIGTSESLTPSGTYQGDQDYQLEIGSATSLGDYGLVGQLQDVRIYNRILTPQEVYSLYANRSINFMRAGLVFHAPMIGAAGLQVFDGAVLGADNKIIDVISGTQGTPAGNPIGRGNIIQRIN